MQRSEAYWEKRQEYPEEGKQKGLQESRWEICRMNFSAIVLFCWHCNGIRSSP
jgi:hypothetical protein